MLGERGIGGREWTERDRESERHSMAFTLPEKTAFLVAAENEFLLFFQKQSRSLACNSQRRPHSSSEAVFLLLIPTRM